VVKRNPLLRRIAHRTLKSSGRDVPSPPVAQFFEPALDHARLLFVYSDLDRDPYVAKSRRLLQVMTAKLTPERRARVESSLIGDGPLSGFESLVVQERVIEDVVRWTVGSLGANGSHATEATDAMGARAIRRR
jgi:hypothetical protein